MRIHSAFLKPWPEWMDTTEGKWRFFAIKETRRFGRLSHHTTD